MFVTLFYITGTGKPRPTNLFFFVSLVGTTDKANASKVLSKLSCVYEDLFLFLTLVSFENALRAFCGRISYMNSKIYSQSNVNVNYITFSHPFKQNQPKN